MLPHLLLSWTWRGDVFSATSTHPEVTAIISAEAEEKVRKCLWKCVLVHFIKPNSLHRLLGSLADSSDVLIIPMTKQRFGFMKMSKLSNHFKSGIEATSGAFTQGNGWCGQNCCSQDIVFQHVEYETMCHSNKTEFEDNGRMYMDLVVAPQKTTDGIVRKKTKWYTREHTEQWSDWVFVHSLSQFSQVTELFVWRKSRLSFGQCLKLNLQCSLQRLPFCLSVDDLKRINKQNNVSS